MIPTIKAEENKELKKLIDESNKHPSKVIFDYIMKNFKDKALKMSDGIEVIVDNGDVDKLSTNPTEQKRAAIGNLRKLIEMAKFDHEAVKVNHNKFKSFRYYYANMEFNNEIYELCLNVGKARNDGRNHLYAIMEGTPTNYGDSRLISNNAVSFSIQDVPSKKNISQ